ncbi:relaxase/mobilization nuclease domain-containing protein [Citromicrobium bathyomarinum]|uniref:relaxase/mobilization nuclease domain-containing protein n=1 Tax=Citromicrobium bathyomarinum TaxID=72174 RepID=UPI00315B3F1B
MTVVFKANRRGQSSAMVEGLRGKAAGLIHYAWRADLRALASALMETAIDPYHADLLRYIKRDAHKEEVAATLTRNLRSDEPPLMAEEMGALIEEAQPTTDIVEHYIVSLKEGERFGDDLHGTVDALLKGLGLQNCPAVAALHRDTDNEHFHLVVLRIDIHSGEIVDPLKYDIIRAHQMLAVIEARTGWSREANARWQVREGRLLLDDQTDIGAANDPSSWPDKYFPPNDLSSGARNKEAKTGVESAERIVRRIVPGLIESNERLPDLLVALRKEGIELSTKGSGAVYRVTTTGDTGEDREEFVRCSVIRKWSYGKLREKYGDLPGEIGKDVRARVPRPINGDSDRPRYALAREQYRERLNSISRDIRMAFPRTAALNEAIISSRSACSFPSFDAWRQGGVPADPGEVFFANLGAKVFEAKGGSQSSQAKRQSDTHFVASRSGRRITYRRRDAILGPGQIVDFGGRVILVGPVGDTELNKTIALFAVRGDKVVSASGLIKAEMKAAKRIAASYGITLIDSNKINLIADGVLDVPENAGGTLQVQPKPGGSAKPETSAMRRHHDRPTPRVADPEPAPPLHSQRVGSSRPTDAVAMATDAWREAENAVAAAREEGASAAALGQLGRMRDRQAWVLQRQLLSEDVSTSDLVRVEKQRLATQAERHKERLNANTAFHAGISR